MSDAYQIVLSNVQSTPELISQLDAQPANVNRIVVKLYSVTCMHTGVCILGGLRKAAASIPSLLSDVLFILDYMTLASCILDFGLCLG